MVVHTILFNNFKGWILSEQIKHIILVYNSMLPPTLKEI